jgi:nitrite reductase/ring-hydroxylating ferredoxin subunit
MRGGGMNHDRSGKAEPDDTETEGNVRVVLNCHALLSKHTNISSKAVPRAGLKKSRQGAHPTRFDNVPRGAAGRCPPSREPEVKEWTRMADVPVCKTSDVPSNSVNFFTVEGKNLAVYNLDGTFYATDDECTHGAASLSEGVLDGDVIECSLHFGAFHIPTGKPVGPPCSIPLRTYRTEVVDDNVIVNLDEAAAD